MDFVETTNLLYDSYFSSYISEIFRVVDVCTPEACPEMAAGPHYSYYWTDFNGSSPVQVACFQCVVILRWVPVSTFSLFSRAFLKCSALLRSINVAKACSPTTSCPCVERSLRNYSVYMPMCTTTISLYHCRAQSSVGIHANRRGSAFKHDV